VIVRVWGARGSLSAPGPATVGYGGNTSCVEVELADGTTVILDAGSGIRELGQRLNERDPGVLHVCLTHLHLDHVEGLGFFEPLWRSGWKLRFWGPPSATTPLRQRVARYLSPPLFPVGLSEAPADAAFEDVPRKPWRVGSALIEAATVEHRGPTVGYRIEDEGPPPARLAVHRGRVRAPGRLGTFERRPRGGLRSRRPGTPARAVPPRPHAVGPRTRGAPRPSRPDRPRRPGAAADRSRRPRGRRWRWLLSDAADHKEDRDGKNRLIFGVSVLVCAA
jgi:hypothetical protein